MERIEIKTPLSDSLLENLKCGDMVYLTGTIYTARDAAHKRMMEAIKEGKDLPFSVNGSVVYYAGPSPAPPGKIIGSVGPTTSGRMDNMTIPLLQLGLKGMIGKGTRSLEVIESIKNNKAIYFAAIGGAGALISKSVISQKIIAYDDLGTEAIAKLEVVKFPLIVAIDSKGSNIYDR